MARPKKVKSVKVKKAKVVKKAAPAAAKKAGKNKGVRYAEDKKIAILKDMADNGMTLKKTAEKYAVSVPTLCIWKRKMAGGSVKSAKPGRRGRKPAAAMAPAIKMSSKEQYTYLLAKVGAAALKDAGLGKYATLEDLAIYVAKLTLALEGVK